LDLFGKLDNEVEEMAKAITKTNAKAEFLTWSGMNVLSRYLLYMDDG